MERLLLRWQPRSDMEEPLCYGSNKNMKGGWEMNFAWTSKRHQSLLSCGSINTETVPVQFARPSPSGAELRRVCSPTLSSFSAPTPTQGALQVLRDQCAHVLVPHTPHRKLVPHHWCFDVTRAIATEAEGSVFPGREEKWAHTKQRICFQLDRTN